MAADMPQSLKKGANPQERAVLFEEAAVTADPTAATDQMVPVGMHARIDMIAAETGGQNCAVALWWWYADSETWVKDLTIGNLAVNANSTAGAVTVPSAASGLYVQVQACPAGGKVSAWLIGRGAIGRF